MTAKDRSGNEAFSGLHELDRIVLQVLGAIRERGGHRDTQHRERPCHSDDNVIYNEDWVGNEDDFETQPQAFHDEGLIEEHQNEYFEPVEGEVVDAQEKSGQQGPLSEAEQHFVRRTVSWLERRDNKDIILDQIWRQLMQNAAADTAETQQRDQDYQEQHREVDDMGSQQTPDDSHGQPADD